MAWIKVDKDTPNKPEVLRLARLWGVDKNAALGICLRFWIWLDGATVDGAVDGLSSHEVDDVMHMPGFVVAMVAVGWLKVDSTAPSIAIPNFSIHNGESAKKRALKNNRQSKWRGNVDASVDAHLSTSASTREDKNREDIKARSKTKAAAAPPVGLEPGLWQHWREARRKAGASMTPHAERLLTAKLFSLKAQGHDPKAVIEQSIERGWKGFFPVGVLPTIYRTDAKTEARRKTAEAIFAPFKTQQENHEERDITGESRRIAEGD